MRVINELEAWRIGDNVTDCPRLLQRRPTLYVNYSDANVRALAYGPDICVRRWRVCTTPSPFGGTPDWGQQRSEGAHAPHPP